MKLTILNIILSVLLVWVFCLELNAQVPAPGYMGKRISIQYELKFNPFSWTRSAWNVKKKKNAPAFRQAIFFDYCASRKISFGLSGEFLMKGLYFTEEIHHTDYAHLRTLGNIVTVYLRVHPIQKFGNIAPIGPYWQFGAGVMIYKTFDYDPDHSFDPSGVGYNRLSFTPVISVAYGHHFVVAKRLLLGLGAETMLNFNWWTLYGKGLEANQVDILMFTHNFFTLNASIGVLL